MLSGPFCCCRPCCHPWFPTMLALPNCCHPRSEYVVVIQRFVETRRAYEWGLVCHALAGAMRHVLQVRRHSDAVLHWEHWERLLQRKAAVVQQHSDCATQVDAPATGHSACVPPCRTGS